MRAPRVLVAIAAAAALSACSKPAPEALTLNGSTLTIDNHSKEEWTNVEVRLNTHFRITTQSIPARGRFFSPLNYFVAGFGAGGAQRFDYNRMQIRDLRLTATTPDGKRIEIKKEFEGDGLKGALAGLAKKK
jgi:hypothetical protein